MFFLNTNCHELTVNFRKIIDCVLMELIGLMKRIRLNRKKTKCYVKFRLIG